MLRKSSIQDLIQKYARSLSMCQKPTSNRKCYSEPKITPDEAVKKCDDTFEPIQCTDILFLPKYIQISLCH